MIKRRVTLSDIAKKAGVHVTTVSLAVRNSPSLPQHTRDRLQALAREMGYTPDPALQALVAYRHQAGSKKDVAPLAYLTHWGSRWGWKKAPAHQEFFNGVEKKTHQLGYAVEHFWMGEPKLSHRRLSDILSARGIQGLIIASHRYDLDTQLDFDWKQFSAVKLDYFPHHPSLHNITNDQRAVSQLATSRAIEAGYRRIGFVMQRRWDLGADRSWSAGFLAEQQCLAPEERIPMLFFDEAQPFETGLPADHAAPQKEFDGWYRKWRPEVVISYAPFVLPCLEALGAKIPHDVAFVDLFLTETNGATAGIRQNCERVGELAAEILIGQLQQNNFGLPPYPTITMVEGTWHDGKTLPRRKP